MLAMVNYSEKLLTKMLQGTNARSIGTQLNSVRALAPYKGSKEAQDLLDLYVGNTHYRQINKALRAPDIDTARRQVWDEAGMMKDKIDYPDLPKEYVATMKFVNPGETSNDAINVFTKDAIQDANDMLEYSNPEQLQKTGLYFKYHPLAYTPGFNELPLIAQAQQVINYKIPEPTIVKLSIANRYNAEDYFQQVLASTPHIENALLQQPAHIPTQTKLNFANFPESIGNAYDDYINQNLAGNTAIQPQHQLALNEHINQIGETPEALGLRAPSRGVLKYGSWKPDEVYNFILEQNPTETRINQPISRGLHFDNEDAYNSFVNQHQPGTVVEYPAFTSTTISPQTQQGFADGRNGKIPVVQNFQTRQGVNRLEARDVNNPEEGERLYVPGQRFKVVESEPFYNEYGSNGRQMTLQETDELPQVQQRTQNILGKMKSLVSEFDRTQARRQADFIQQPDGSYQALVDGNPYKQLSPEEMQIAVRNTRNRPGWNLNIR